MWVELECGDSVVSGAFGQRRIKDKAIPVNIMDLGTPVSFNPNRRYGFEKGDKGSKDRIIVAAHTKHAWFPPQTLQQVGMRQLPAGAMAASSFPFHGDHPRQGRRRPQRHQGMVNGLIYRSSPDLQYGSPHGVGSVRTPSCQPNRPQTA